MAERNELAKEVGRVKASKALPIEDEGVEEELLQIVQTECDGLGIDREAGARVLNVLLGESKRVQGGQNRSSSLVTPMMIAAKALELQRRGEKLLRLDVGEPDFRPPKAVVDACSRAMYEFKTHYTQTRGIPSLVEALQRYLMERHGFAAQESEVIMTPGGRYAVYAALRSVLKEGDRCIVIEPNWPAYKECLEFIGARATTIHTTLEEGWKPSVEMVEASIRANTKAIVLSYPVNPTGKLIDQKLFDELVEVANDHSMTVVSDEIYTDYAYSDCPSILKSHTKSFVLTSSFSKTWAMTGFRVGYAVSSQDTVSMMMKIQALMITSVPEFIQYGAIKALDVKREVMENAEAMKERIEAAAEELDKIEEIEYYRPDGAMYVFPRVDVPGFDASSFTMKIMQEKKVSISPGNGFGDYPDCFRISLGNSKETIVEGIRRLGEAIR